MSRASTDRSAGNILHLPDALRQHPDALFGMYNRVSGYHQSGLGKAKLQQKNQILFAGFRAYCKAKVLFGRYGIERGKLSNPRPNLDAIVEEGQSTAQRSGRAVIVVSTDLSRFIRAEDYHRPTNPEAWPTAAEFAELEQRTLGLVLATLADPLLTEKERHKWVMQQHRQAGRCGRRSTMTYELGRKIFAALGTFNGEETPGRWETSIAKVARQLGIAPALIQRLVQSPVPSELVGGPECC
jgi:hypothetical protein